MASRTARRAAGRRRQTRESTTALTTVRVSNPRCNGPNSRMTPQPCSSQRRRLTCAIANNAEIDVIWAKHQPTLEQLRTQLNFSLKQSWQEWEIPREADAEWSRDGQALHAEWWKLRIRRQQEIDASIAARAESEYQIGHHTLDHLAFCFQRLEFFTRSTLEKLATTFG